MTYLAFNFLSYIRVKVTSVYKIGSIFFNDSLRLGLFVVSMAFLTIRLTPHRVGELTQINSPLALWLNHLILIWLIQVQISLCLFFGPCLIPPS